MKFAKALKQTIAAVTACCVSLSAGAGAFTETVFAGNVNVQYLSLGTEVTQKGLVFTELEDGTYEVGYDINGNKPVGSLKIPAAVNGKPVTRIAEAGFYGCDELVSVTVPDSVTSAGANAFTGTPFQNDQSGAVKYAGNVAVFCDSSAESVTIKDGTLGLADRLFSLTPGLKKAVLPESLINIGNMAFMDCAALTSVNIPSRITTIGSGTFYGCAALKSVTIPESVTEIGSYAFAESGITSVKIPNVTKIGKGAFENSKLKAKGVTVGRQYIDIGGMAFSGTAYYDGLGAAKYVGTVFVGCDNDAESVTIKNGTTAIADMAFSGRHNLRSVTIPKSVKTIGADAFFNCNKLDADIVIPEGVESIGEDAFRLCGSLPSVSLPASLKSVGEGAFYGCDMLKTVTYPGSVEDWGNIEAGDDDAMPAASPKFGKKPNAPEAVKNLKITKTTFNSFALSWDGSELANRYRVDVKKNGKWQTAGYTADTAFTVEGLSQATDYELRVYALTHNTKSAAELVSGTTKVASVTGLKTSSVSDSVSVSWKKVSGAEYYRVDIYKDGKWSAAVKTKNGSVTACTVNGLSPSTEYQFRIFTFIGSAHSDAVKFSAVTTKSDKPSAVTGLKAEPSLNSVKLSWEQNLLADKYQIDIYKDGAWTYLATTEDLSYKVTGLSSGTEYRLRVFAFKGDKFSSPSAVKTTTKTPVSTKPSAVTGLTASPSTSGIKLSWNKNPSADKYQIDIFKNGKWTFVKTTANSSYTISGLSADTEYQLRVFAFRGNEHSAASKITAKTKPLSSGKPETVTGFTASAGTNSVSLSWNKSANADRYQIDVYKNGSWSYVATAYGTSYTVSGLSSGVSYEFRIFAFKGSNYSSSARVSATTGTSSGKPETVTGFTASAGANSVSLSWNKSPNADRYQIDVYKNGSWTYVSTVYGTSYTVSGLSSGVSYEFRIFAFKGGTYSPSARVSATTGSSSGKPETVTGFSASAGTNSVSLSWNKSANADRYQIDVYKNGSWTYVSTVYGTSYTVSGLSVGTNYEFRIFAFKGSAYSPSARVSATTGASSGKPETVTGFTASAGTNSVSLLWNKSANADRYQIDMYKNGSWTYVSTVYGTSYTVSGLSVGTNYEFRIFAFKGSAYSPSVRVSATTGASSSKPAAVTGLTASPDTNSITLSWNMSANADSYQIDMLVNGIWTYVTRVTGTSHKVTGLASGKSYQFRVFAFKGSNYSTLASVSSTTLALLAPEATRAAAAEPTPAALSSVNTMLKGIDVSGWQGDIDFNAVKESGVDFVIVKAGERNSTVDTWETNYAKAKHAGLMVGSYWYSRAVTLDEGKQEANAFIAALKGKQLEFPVFFDIEESAQFEQGVTFCTDLVETFCGTLEKAGYCAGVYCSTYWYTNFITDSVRLKRPAWIADYRGSCYYNAAFGMWQYDAGEVAGIDCDCDRNRGYIDYSIYIKENHLNGF